MFIHRHLFIGIHTSHYTLIISRQPHTVISILLHVGTQNDVTVTVCEIEEKEEAFPTGLYVNICHMYFKTI